MEILLEHYTVPERGEVELDVHRKFAIHVTAAEAQRQVNQWVLLEVSCVMGALAPSLVIGERVTWRVPIELTAPHIGHVGVAGFVDVDVQTGQMDVSPERIVDL
jgi:hypothetical protein